MSSDDRRARAVDRPVVTAPAPRRSRRDRGGYSARCHQLWTCEEAVLRPGLGVGAHPGDAVALAALHLHHMRHRVPRPAVARLELDRRAAARLGARDSRRSPRGRTRACRARRDSPACSVDQAGSARAMRSRSMRALPVKKSIWWPDLQRQHVARMLDRRCPRATRAASCQRPSASWRDRRHVTAFACVAGQPGGGSAGIRARPRVRPARCQADADTP